MPLHVNINMLGEPRIVDKGTVIAPAKSTVTIGTYILDASERPDAKIFVNDNDTTSEWGTGVPGNPFTDEGGLHVFFKRTSEASKVKAVIKNNSTKKSRNVSFVITAFKIV